MQSYNNIGDIRWNERYDIVEIITTCLLKYREIAG